MAAYSPNDVVQAVVADIGQGQSKLGFAGEDYPCSYFRSVSQKSAWQMNAPHFSLLPVDALLLLSCVCCIQVVSSCIQPSHSHYSY